MAIFLFFTVVKDFDQCQQVTKTFQSNCQLYHLYFCNMYSEIFEENSVDFFLTNGILLVFDHKRSVVTSHLKILALNSLHFISLDLSFQLSVSSPVIMIVSGKQCSETKAIAGDRALFVDAECTSCTTVQHRSLCIDFGDSFWGLGNPATEVVYRCNQGVEISTFSERTFSSWSVCVFNTFLCLC